MRIAVGILVAILLLLGGIRLWHSERVIFSHLFLEARAGSSLNRIVPFWGNTVPVCIYGVGTTVGSVVENRLSRFSTMMEEAFNRKLPTILTTSVDECPLSTVIYISVYEGPVSRRAVEENYDAIALRAEIAVDTRDPMFYESAFAQAAVFGGEYRAVVAVLINQVANGLDSIGRTFVEANVLEEMFQSSSLASDLMLNGPRISILEETLVETPELWQGRYSGAEATAYLEQRPLGLCRSDLMILLYDKNSRTLELPAWRHLGRLLWMYNSLYSEATTLLRDDQWHDLIDEHCTNDATELAAVANDSMDHEHSRNSTLESR
jgi:hypothetical protein